MELMSTAFALASSFNSDMSKWSTGRVRDVSALFAFASSFNSDISQFDVSQVTDMGSLLAKALSFKRENDLADWDTGRVKYMDAFFSGATFNPNVSAWK